MMTKYRFIFASMVFFGLIIQLEALAFASNAGLFLLNSNGVNVNNLQAPVCNAGYVVIDGVIKCLFQNLGFFITLMSLSSDLAIFNGTIIFGFAATVMVIILEFIRGN